MSPALQLWECSMPQSPFYNTASKWKQETCILLVTGLPSHQPEDTLKPLLSGFHGTAETRGNYRND